MISQHKKWLESDGEQGERASFQDLDLRGADLRGADLRNAYFGRANLTGADLRGVNLNDTWVNSALFRDADLRGACLRDTSFTGAKADGIDLRGADLREAVFSSTDLRRAKLDVGFRDCSRFWHARFTADALPWLILHPLWNEGSNSVRIEPTERTCLNT